MPDNTIAALFAAAAPGLCHYLILALIIFVTGLMITITSGTLIKTLIGFELMLNAVCINFAAIDAFNKNTPQGQIFTLIIMAVGAINVAAGLGLICAVYFKLKKIGTNTLETLKSEDCPETLEEGEI